jgi:glutamate/tyrosine decarboxylase-like PLP-dependent enzyme
MWINVDAAYLGSSWICPELRPDMKLFEQIDSMNINFSKSLFLGTGGSLLFVADKKAIISSFDGDLNFGFFKN